MSERPAGDADAVLAAMTAAMGASRVVDLSVPLAEHLPAAWPTHMPFQRKVYNWYADRPAGSEPEGPQPLLGHRGPYCTAWITLDEHCGCLLYTSPSPRDS